MRALVTGAAGGIGGATVELLLDRGVDVVAQDLRVAQVDPRVSAAVEADLTADEGLMAVDGALGEEPLDWAFAAHGVEGSGALATIEERVVRKIMDVDFLSVVRLYELLEARLAASHGAYVLVSSQAGLVGEPNNGVYCAAKFGLVGWARALAASTEETGVRVRALCPGCTDTPLLRAALEGMADDAGITIAEMEARRQAAIPAGRLATPRDQAAAAILLAELSGSGPVVAPVTGGEVLW